MTTNPFVLLGSDPLLFFALLGYALLCASVAILASAYAWKTTAWLYVQYDRRHKSWDSPYLPPAGVTLRAASVPFVLALAAWALGGLVWLFIPG